MSSLPHHPGDAHAIRLPTPDGVGVEMRFRHVPAGRFRMGSRGMGRLVRWFNNEEPVHWVEITQPFWMAETPVTQAQFGAWKPGHQNRFSGLANHPAENMTWDEAFEYCRWLWEAPELRGQLPDRTIEASLPTEAQWERACRGQNDSEAGHMGHRCDYYAGDGDIALKAAGWYGRELGEGLTHPVGEKCPNSWGLRDLHGNVWEWCRDLWHANPYIFRVDGVKDPETTAEIPGSDSTRRAIRGGSWYNPPLWCRTACRGWGQLTHRYWHQGFRPVLLLAASHGRAVNRLAEDPISLKTRKEAKNELKY
jgi:formylglycine-generating enzyme required for sulfatase activity